MYRTRTNSVARSKHFKTIQRSQHLDQLVAKFNAKQQSKSDSSTTPNDSSNNDKSKRMIIGLDLGYTKLDSDIIPSKFTIPSTSKSVRWIKHQQQLQQPIKPSPNKESARQPIKPVNDENASTNTVEI